MVNKIQCTVRESVLQFAVVAKFHEQSSEQTRSDVFVSTKNRAPSICIFAFGTLRFVLDDILAFAAFQLLSEFLALLIFIAGHLIILFIRFLSDGL